MRSHVILPLIGLNECLKPDINQMARTFRARSATRDQSNMMAPVCL